MVKKSKKRIKIYSMKPLVGKMESGVQDILNNFQSLKVVHRRTIITYKRKR